MGRTLAGGIDENAGWLRGRGGEENENIDFHLRGGMKAQIMDVNIDAEISQASKSKLTSHD